MPHFQASTGRLDISCLDKEPQANMAVVRAILTSAVKRVLNRLAKQEKAFYGPSKTAVQAVSKYNSCVKAVLEESSRSVLSSANQMEDIFRQAADPRLRFTVDTFDLNKLKEAYRKVLDTVPSKFNDLIKDIREIVKYLEKYCLSFYDIKEEDGLYLDTGHNYEKQRQDLQRTINDNLDGISSMVQKFKNANLFSTDFSSVIIELGRKSGCSSAPFLLLFPAAVENIRNSCSAMMCWIDADDNYALFISNDIKDMEQKKKDTEKKAHDHLQKYHQLLFRLNQLQTECEKMTAELAKLIDKDNELTIEEECLVSETNDMQVEIEMKEYRRDELLKNASHLHPEVLYEKYSELSEDLRDLKMRLPFTKRQLAAVQYKLHWIGEKKEELNVEKKKLDAVEKEMEQLEQMKQELDVEKVQLVGLLEKARHIHVYKSSPDAVEKIFYGRPVVINKTRLPGFMDKDDPFERICQVVAGTLEGDWPKLYRNLPFYPARGFKTIDDDIHEFSNLTSRQGTSYVVMRCLHRWRRYHTRARLEDLLETLTKIHRHDILEAIDLELNPPRPPTPKEEVYPDFLEEHLIPFWKEVEKFDQLRAANKI